MTKPETTAAIRALHIAADFVGCLSLFVTIYFLLVMVPT